MSRPTEDVEAILAEAYREQIGIYAGILETLHDRPDMDATANGDHAWLKSLTAGLDRVAAVERRVGAAKAQWQASQARPGPNLAAHLSRAAELIRQLAAEVGVAVAEAEAKRRRLLPEADVLVRSLRMQKAYGVRRT